MRKVRNTIQKQVDIPLSWSYSELEKNHLSRVLIVS